MFVDTSVMRWMSKGFLRALAEHAFASSQRAQMNQKLALRSTSCVDLSSMTFALSSKPLKSA